MGEPNAKAKWSKYAIAEDGTLERKAEHCPNCGPGVFLGVHSDRKPAEDAVILSRLNELSYHHW